MPIIDFSNNFVKLFFSKGGKGHFFREVLSDEPVRVFVKAPFLRVIGMRKENIDRERL
jgi:hypothetical protein